MRRIKAPRRELHDIARRDSFVDRFQLGYLAAPYDGGKTVRVLLTEQGYGEVTAVIPTFLQPPAARAQGSPVLVRTQRGFVQIMDWVDPNPILHYVDAAAAFTIASTTRTTISLIDDSVLRDDLEIFDDTNNRAVVADGWNGLWTVQLGVRWQANASGSRRLWVQKNDTTDIDGISADSVDNIPWFQSTYSEVFLESGDYLKFEARHSAGGNLDIEQIRISMRFVRP